MTRFGENLRNLLKAKNLKSLTLAEKMGVSSAYVSQLMTGNRRPGRETLLKLSKSLDVPVETLIKLESDNLDHILSSRKVPVCSVDSTDVKHPSMITETFEYAITNDSDAFYVKLSCLQSCNGLDAFDLILIEPNGNIESGNTVLVCLPDEISVRKITMKDTLVILSNDNREPIIYSKENINKEMRILRASRCIKNL